MAGHKKLTEYPETLEIAEKHNATAAQVLIAWGAKRGYSVIPKSVTPGGHISPSRPPQGTVFTRSRCCYLL